MRQVVDIVEEPRNDLWRRFISSVGPLSAHVLLVLRDDLGLEESADEFLLELSPHLRERERGSSWPGTSLWGAEATILRYSTNEIVLSTLAGAVDGLFEWLQPNMPEDLALIRADGTVILGTVCHEQDAYLELSDGEMANLIREVPEIARMIQPHISRRLKDDET